MRQYWERTLSRIEQESPNIKQARSGAAERVQARAQELKEQAHAATARPEQGPVVAATSDGSNRGASLPPSAR